MFFSAFRNFPKFKSNLLAKMSTEAHKLLMIPGPVEFTPEVLSAMSSLATSHVDPSFIDSFGTTLENMRKVWLSAQDSQPFILAGSGTLTWDMTAANLIEKAGLFYSQSLFMSSWLAIVCNSNIPGDAVLVVNSGIFGDWFAECMQVYGGDVTQITAPFGDIPTLAAIETALTTKKYKVITVTHVDTSTGVLADIKSIAEVVRRVSPETLICLDGVCSVGAEEIRMKAWGLDVVMTGSQKAIGVPPGLALMVVSKRAMDVATTRKSPPSTYFASFNKWAPIMKKYEARQPSYFATPPVQLILALEVSLKQLLEKGMDFRFDEHKKASHKFKAACAEMGLKMVPVSSKVAANTLSALYYPEGVSGGDLLKLISAAGVIVAGGLHPSCNTKYFRIGHMNVSAHLGNGHVDKVISVLSASLKVLRGKMINLKTLSKI